MKPSILGIGNIDVQPAGGADVSRFVELFLVEAEATDLNDEVSLGIKLLNSIVTRISYKNIPFWTDGDALRFEELARPTPQGTDDF